MFTRSFLVLFVFFGPYTKAYNKDVQDDAARNVFGAENDDSGRRRHRVTCMTTHALALFRVRRIGLMAKKRIVSRIEESVVVSVARRDCNANRLNNADARVVSKVVDEYMVSTELRVTADHVAKHKPDATAQQVEQTQTFAQAVVDAMFDREDTEVSYTHNGYLKRWFTLPDPSARDLSDDFDIILNDEVGPGFLNSPFRPIPLPRTQPSATTTACLSPRG